MDQPPRVPRGGAGLIVRAALPALALVLAACAAPRPPAADASVRTAVRERLAADVPWQETTPVVEPPAASEPLSREAAVRMALAHNPDCQMLATQLGLAQAEWLAVTRWPNPVVALATRFPLGTPSGLDIEFGVLARLLDVLMRPARMRVSGLAVEQAALEAGAGVLRLAGDVDAAYWTLVGARHKQRLLDDIASAADTAAALAQRQYEAGLLAALPLAHEQGLSADARAAALAAGLAAGGAATRLGRLLGIADPAALPAVPAVLAALPASPASAQDPGAAAVRDRLEIEAARKAIDGRAAEHAIALDWRWWSVLAGGVGGQRDSDRHLTVGPSIEVALPIFDRGDARGARTASALRRAQLVLASRVLDVRSEAIGAAFEVRERHAIARHIEQVLLPLQTRIAELTRRAHELDRSGTLELLLSQRRLLMTTAEHSDALRDYWLAEARLRRALGGRPLAAPILSAPARARSQ